MKILERIKIIPKKKEKEPVFQALILKQPLSKNSYGGKILGRYLYEWVAFACNGINKNIIEYSSGLGLLDFAKPYINSNYDYTIILTSTTPLITQKTIQDIIEYCSFKGVALCKLPNGYVVNNNYFLNNEYPNIDSLYSQNLEDFYLVEIKKQYTQAEEILQERINNFHINNGVEIRKQKTVYIEPEVDISAGVVIFPGNSLKGKTVILENVILKENNVIEDSKIGENSCVSSSVIENTNIENNVYISAFCSINDSKICEKSIIGSHCKINKTQISQNSNIKSNTVLGEDYDSNSGVR